MSNLLVTINLVVLNGEKYIRYCLDAILAQTYPHELIELNILDNGSTDKTKEIINGFKFQVSSFKKFFLLESKKNLGMWPGNEKLLEQSGGKYILCVSVDVIIDEHFVERAVAICETNPAINAVQAKIYQYQYNDLAQGTYKGNAIIDTCGFAMTPERKVINIGHGKFDGPEFSAQRVIFGVEGAVPFFRRTALEDCRIKSWIWDPDYFWYGDDLDLAWRMTLFGHRQVYEPTVVAWHDRSTTKDAVNTDFISDHIKRCKLRQQIPVAKRRLDWSNTRFTVIKNDHWLNLLRDSPAIAMREINVQGYAGLFEQKVLLEWGRFLYLLPRMLVRRQIVMKRARMKADEMRSLMLVNVLKDAQTPPSEYKWRLLRIIMIGLIVSYILWVLLYFSLSIT